MLVKKSLIVVLEVSEQRPGGAVTLEKVWKKRSGEFLRVCYIVIKSVSL